MFPGGRSATWQSVLVTSQFFGAANPIATGVEPELDLAVSVFAGTTNVTVPVGCKALWSPTNPQFVTLQGLYNSTAESVTDDDWSVVGAPRLWLGMPRQAVVKSSIGSSTVQGNTAAPAFVLFRLALSGSDPAVITVP
jgi:hypothetical protein